MANQKGFEHYLTSDRILTGNYADYDFCEPYAASGFMEFHTDFSVHEEKSWTIKPVWWAQDVAFMQWLPKKGYQLINIDGSNFTVFFKHKHALLPLSLAEEILIKQRVNLKSYKDFKKKFIKPGDHQQPVLIWDWI